uniref:Solute carrier family 29 member 2 n=1 Tax=Labrus bergylta TaxID=56723 RepID=A0A3Q3L2X7_9LABR
MKGRTDAPQDRGCMVGIIFFILGLGTLLPWNFFMTASLYFQGRLNTTEMSNGTLVVRKEYYFNNWMTLLSQLPLLLFTLLNSFLYQRISGAIRIGGSLVFILLLFIFTAVLVKVPMEEDSFFSVTMATIWFINSFGAVLQGSLFGLVGLLPQKYSAIFMSGQGLAGTFAAIAMLIAIGSDVDSETAALGYFVTPCVGTLLTLFSYMLLPRLEFARYHLDNSNKYEAETTDGLLKESGAAESGKLNGHANSTDEAAGDQISDATTKHTILSLEPAKASVKEVFKKIWVMAFCVTFVFTSHCPSSPPSLQTSEHIFQILTGSVSLSPRAASWPSTSTTGSVGPSPRGYIGRPKSLVCSRRWLSPGWSSSLCSCSVTSRVARTCPSTSTTTLCSPSSCVSSPCPAATSSASPCPTLHSWWSPKTLRLRAL